MTNVKQMSNWRMGISMEHKLANTTNKDDEGVAKREQRPKPIPPGTEKRPDDTATEIPPAKDD